MVNIEITFRYLRKPDEDEVSEGVNGLVGAWSQNGQILDGEWPITFGRDLCRAVVSVPDVDAFRAKNNNKWARRALTELRSRGLRKPTFRVLGAGLDSPKADRCERPSWYVLVTAFLWVESPLRCGDHYLPVPLYRIKPTDKEGHNHHGVLCWQCTWKACDQLQMLCGPGERFGTRQISDVDSPLSRQGLEVCRSIEDVTGVATYYYLFRGAGRTVASERARLCPSCGRRWLLPKRVHIFDFRCDRCRLVSHIACGIE